MKVVLHFDYRLRQSTRLLQVTDLPLPTGGRHAELWRCEGSPNEKFWPLRLCVGCLPCVRNLGLRPDPQIILVKHAFL